jgi:histidine triad (HIT) family protein
MITTKRLLIILSILAVTAWVSAKFDFKKPPPCAFCEKETLDAQEFARDSGVIALLTYKPVTTGHVLIIPARHVENFEELTEYEIAAMGKMVKKIDRVIKARYGNTSYILLHKSGEDAGATVPHAHMHYLPRYPKENHLIFALRFWFIPLLKPISQVEIAKELAFLQSAMRSSRL